MLNEEIFGLFALPDSLSSPEIREMIEEIRDEYLHEDRSTKEKVVFLGTRLIGGQMVPTMMVLDLYNLYVYVDVGYTTSFPHSAPFEILEKARIAGEELLRQYLASNSTKTTSSRELEIPWFRIGQTTVNA